MVRSAIRVVLRPRPSSNFATDLIQILPDKQKVVLTGRKRDGLGVVNHQQEQFQFQFDQVLHNTGQEGVYETCARDAVASVLDGYNATIMAYGQTGAGKTYTMTGGKYTQGSFQQRGIVPRCIADIFNQIKARPQMAVTVRVAYCEIYNEVFYDLLSDAGAKVDIAVQEDSKGGVHVKGLTYHIVNSEEDALGLLFEGETNRAIAEHQLNKMSSRSHAVFSLTLEVRPQGAADERVLLSKLHLVDLAGSERLSKTKSEGSVAREAQYINKSLTFLEQVIMALSNKNRDHIPYRSSKLTHLLKDAIGGNCKTLMVANVWGEADHIDETLSTCKFAQRMMRVSNDADQNLRQDPEMLLRKYERDIRELKQELAMHDAMSNRSRTSYEPYTEVQKLELRGTVLDFLTRTDARRNDDVDPLELPSLRHIREVLFQCRDLYQAKPGPGQAGGAPAESDPGAIASRNASNAPNDSLNPDQDVGDLDGPPSSLESMQLAPDDARPVSPLHSTPRGLDADGGGSHESNSDPAPLDKNEAFVVFKQGPGAEAAAALAENKAMLKEKRRRMRDLAGSINATKHSIDESRARVEAMREQTAAAGGEGAASPEEYACLVQMKELKQKYREEHDELNMLKSEVDYTARLSKECTKLIVSDFERWYTGKYGNALLMASGACNPSSPVTSTAFLPSDMRDDDDEPAPKSSEMAFKNAQRSTMRKAAVAPKPVTAATQAAAKAAGAAKKI